MHACCIPLHIPIPIKAVLEKGLGHSATRGNRHPFSARQTVSGPTHFIPDWENSTGTQFTSIGARTGTLDWGPASDDRLQALTVEGTPTQMGLGAFVTPKGQRHQHFWLYCQCVLDDRGISFRTTSYSHLVSVFLLLPLLLAILGSHHQLNKSQDLNESFWFWLDSKDETNFRPLARVSGCPYVSGGLVGVSGVNPQDV